MLVTFETRLHARVVGIASPMTHEELEHGNVLNLDFTKLRKVANCDADVLPAIAQDANTGEVLIVGYANQLAFATAQECGMATLEYEPQ